MFTTFLFFAFFVAGCLLVAEPVPQVAVPTLAVPVEDDLPSLEELLTEAEALTARPVPTMAAAVAAPVAVSVVKVEASAKPVTEMNSAELRKECSRRGIAWRNAHGQGKHMKKGEMVAALR